jgi:hypothetical protein
MFACAFFFPVEADPCRLPKRKAAAEQLSSVNA